GWCPREDLDHQVELPDGKLDPHQQAGWEQVKGSAWASQYWPCLGAIAQIAVFPNPAGGVEGGDYPYFIDFEPKKRGLYGTASNTGEVLSGSASGVNTNKCTTTTESIEAKVDVKGGMPGVSAEASVGASASEQRIDNYATDTSREKRETQSHSTQFA